MAEAFIIMQIGNAELDRMAATAMVPAVTACGLNPKRVDKHNEGGLLKSEIVRFIQNADIIVADLTNERQNCYLEIGYVMGIDKFKNLILTAREDHFVDSPNHVRSGPKVHFDLAGYDILGWHPDQLDKFRVELEKRIRRRLAIIGPEVSDAESALDLDWISSQRAIADQGIQKTPRAAYMELAFSLQPPKPSFSPNQLNDAAQKAPIHTFGWPIALYLHKDGLRPRPRADGVFAEVIGEHKDSYDYWAIRRNGDFYWRGSLFEDERRPGVIFFDTRIVRVTEAFLYCARLYSHLEVDRAAIVNILFRHVGLKDRHLAAANSRRVLADRAPSIENESEATLSIRLEQIESDIVGLVKAVLDPMFSLFDFFQLDDGVYADIVNKYVRGEV